METGGVGKDDGVSRLGRFETEFRKPFLWNLDEQTVHSPLAVAVRVTRSRRFEDGVSSAAIPAPTSDRLDEVASADQRDVRVFMRVWSEKAPGSVLGLGNDEARERATPGFVPKGDRSIGSAHRDSVAQLYARISGSAQDRFLRDRSGATARPSFVSTEVALVAFPGPEGCSPVHPFDRIR